MDIINFCSKQLLRPISSGKELGLGWGRLIVKKKKKVTHKNGLNVKVAHKKNVFAVNICVLVKKIYIFYNHQALML